MKKRIVLSALFVGLLAGCGSGFLGLEDYQRDILGVLIATQIGQTPDVVNVVEVVDNTNIVSSCTTLCHCSGSSCSTLTVSAPAVQAHLNHGDTCGICP